MTRLYHPKQGKEIEAATPEVEAIHAAAGWVPAPDPPPARPGYEPEPLRYELGDDGLYHPVLPEPEPEPEPVKVRRANKAAETN